MKNSNKSLYYFFIVIVCGVESKLYGRYVNVIGFVVWMGGKGCFRWVVIMSWICDVVKADSFDGWSLVKVYVYFISL